MGNASAMGFGAALLGVLTVAAAAPAQNPVQPPPGLLAWWAMDGNADDIGPLAFDGALAQAGGTFPAARVLAGFHPTAPDGHIAVPDAPELHLHSNFTFEAWVRLDVMPTSVSYMVNKGTADHRATPFTFGIIGSDGVLAASSVVGVRAPGRLFVSMSDGTADRAVISNQALTLGTFAHVAFTVTDTLCVIYINGSPRGSMSGPRLPFAGVQALRLGGIVGGNMLTGVLDEVTCYTRALGLAEIQAIFNAGALGKVKTDRRPPLVAIDQPLADAVVAGPQVLVSASVIDSSSTTVASVPAGLSVSLPAGGGIATGTVTLPGPDGAQVIAVAATDAANNTAATSVTVTLDTTAPIVAVVTPAEGMVLGTSPAAFAVSVGDLTATSVQVGPQSMTLPPGQSTVVFDVSLQEGGNAVTFAVTDAAGHQTVVVRNVVLDLSTPIVAIDSPPDGALFGAGQAGVAVTARVDDLTATTVASTPAGVDGALPAGGGLLSGMVTLAEGLNQIAVRATDEVGHQSEAVVTVNLDSTPPAVTFASPDVVGAVHGIVGVEATAADIAPGSGVERIELFVDGTLLASAAGAVCRFDLDTATLADGNRELRAVASDGAGNAGNVTMVLTVDNTPPEVRILEPLANAAVQGNVAFVAIASDSGAGVASVVQRVGGRAPTGDGSTAFEPPMASCQVIGSEDTLQSPNGALQFEIEATDAAGNATIVAVEVEVQNLQGGEGPRLLPRDGACVSGRVRIRVTSDRHDIIDLELQVDGVRIAFGHGHQLSAWYDTTERMDGPMVVRAQMRTDAGLVETVHTVRVRNLELQRLAPNVLSIDDRRAGEVHAVVCGPAEAMRQLLECQLQLRLPGGAVVPMCSVAVLPGSHGEARCSLGFDRPALIAALRAARATDAIPPRPGHVRVQLCAGDLIVGRTGLELCGGHGGSR